MRILLALATTLFAAACTVPQVNVKQRWNKALVNYSFVPIYPARGDLEVGDVRVHTIKNAAEALDSRLISDWTDNDLLAEQPKFATAVLPGLEAVRTLSLDAEATGLTGLLRRLIGSRVDATASLYVSLQDLKIAEVPDHQVARAFHDYVKKEILAESPDTNDLFFGLCASAKTLGNPKFDDLAISVVTRVIRAGKIAYHSGNSLTNMPAAPNPTPAGATATTPPKDTAENTFNVGTATSLSFTNIGANKVVVGVDALMIRPRDLDKGIAKKCQKTANYFETSQARVLSRNRPVSSAGD